jgi:N,N'-diacetyllegionaminate synthase
MSKLEASSKSPIIIAEVGVNHNGDLDLAMKLIDLAAAAGADIVKFQTFAANKLAIPDALQATYQTENTGKVQTQKDLLKPLELTMEMHARIIKKCHERGIEFLSTAFDLDSLEFLIKMGIRRVKIPSGEITNLPYLEKCGKSNLPIILSTGMATLIEVKAAVKILLSNGADKNNITVLHCTTSYPTKSCELNMSAISTLQNHLGLNIGYSDHSSGADAAIMAVALGATVIEKHITTNKKLDGPDHVASMEPDEFFNYVKTIRKSSVSMGDGEKTPSRSEKNNIVFVRKSIVASRTIEKGEAFSSENLDIKRPGLGINPMQWYNIIGKVAKRDFNLDEMIEI